jgi:hypothetical protein
MPAWANTGSGSCDPRAGVRRGGFTLLELTVVLVGLAALAAIALPMLLDRTGEAAFREAGSSLVAAVAQARLQSLGDGRPRHVLVVYERGRWRIATEFWSDPEGSEGAVRRRVVLELPDGVRIERREAVALRPRFVGPVLEEDFPASFEAEVPPPEGWSIALFTADGEAFPGLDLVLADGSGRRSRLVIEGGTRRVMLQPIEAKVPTDPAGQAGESAEGGVSP